MKLTLLVFLTTILFAPVAWGADKGAALYELCAFCHGQQGQGQEDIHTPAIAGLPKWYVIEQLKKFSNGARGAHKDDIIGLKMRPMARTLKGDQEIAAVAEFVANMKPPKLQDTIKGSVIAGEQVYAPCLACHGPDGMGVKDLVPPAPPLLYSNDWYLKRQLENFKAGRRGYDAAKDLGGAAMRPMAMMLSEEAMNNVIVYIRALADQGE